MFSINTLLVEGHQSLAISILPPSGQSPFLQYLI